MISRKVSCGNKFKEIFEFEDKDIEKSSNCFHCKENLPVILFDKVKVDYARIRGIKNMPNSCDYVILIGTEIWLIEEKDILCELVQKLVKLKNKLKSDKFTKDEFYEIFMQIIKKRMKEVYYDFIYSLDNPLKIYILPLSL